MNASIFIVMLRQPGKNDRRGDPFWEFGSFGCTGCHSKNLLHPLNSRIQDGDRLAFVQGGDRGAKLLLITPPVRRVVHGDATSDQRLELRWDARKKPFKYDRAPSLFESNSPRVSGRFPKLIDSLEGTNRTTIDAKFASRYRARTRPLTPELADELLAGFDSAVREASRADFIAKYEDALPWCDCPTPAADRQGDYESRLSAFGGGGKVAARKSRCCG